MKLAFYIGEHAEDTLMVRAGWWITKFVQKGPYSHVTHVEAIHTEYSDGSVFIASSSIRDNGVRGKRVKLNPAHWMIVDMPQWDTLLSVNFLEHTKYAPYDWRGAIATCMPGHENDNSWFCNEWVAYPYLKSSSNFGPHQLAAICLSMGTNVTFDFFKPDNRKST
jgi:hypothetical protein